MKNLKYKVVLQKCSIYYELRYILRLVYEKRGNGENNYFDRFYYYNNF